MLDVSKEDLRSFTAAARETPGRPHVSTIWRWASRGIRGIYLETVRVGGRTYTSTQAIERFIAATSAAANGNSPPVRTPHQRAAAIAAAKRELETDGI